MFLEGERDGWGSAGAEGELVQAESGMDALKLGPSLTSEELGKMVSMINYSSSSLNMAEKCRVISELRKLSYKNLFCSRWKIPRDYDFRKSTAENYAALPGERQHVGRFEDIRKMLDTDYHGYYMPERQVFQDKLIESVIRSGNEIIHPWIIFTAGPMGAGKSHTLEWMSDRGYFPLKEIVQLDPDKFKCALPEWEKYVEVDIMKAGLHTQKESGMLVEIGQMAAMRAQKNVWIDGSFRDGEWYETVFENIRREHPEYRIAIIYVHAKRETVLRRVKKRAQETGRYVPEQDIEDSLKRVPEAVWRLAPNADFVANIENDGDTPKLTGWSDEHDACLLNACGSFEEISKRFTTEPKQRTKASWRNFIARVIEKNPVMVFTKSQCSQTHKLKALLCELNVNFCQVALDEGCYGGPAMAEVLEDKTGYQTTPLLFVKGTFVGGFDESHKLHRAGRLQKMLGGEIAQSS